MEEATGGHGFAGRCIMNPFDSMKKIMTERRLGFQMDEIMTGTHRFVDGSGPEGSSMVKLHMPEAQVPASVPSWGMTVQ